MGSKTKIKKFLFFITTLFFGVIIGIYGTLWIKDRNQVSDDINIVSYSLFESEEATNQYFFSNSIDNGIYALEHFIKFENFFLRKYLELYTDQEKENFGLFDKNIPFDLVVAYTRLGLLYEKKGAHDRAVNKFQKAFEIQNTHKLFEKWIGTEKEIGTIEDLIRFVSEVDDRYRKREKD